MSKAGTTKHGSPSNWSAWQLSHSDVAGGEGLCHSASLGWGRMLPAETAFAFPSGTTLQQCLYATLLLAEQQQ